MEEAEIAIRFRELGCALENGNILLIDVRREDEIQNNGKFPYSSVLNIPFEDLYEAFQMNDNTFYQKYARTKPSPGDAIAFSCTMGKRAAKAYEIALDFGFTNARIYYGSFNDWDSRGGVIIPCKKIK